MAWRAPSASAFRERLALERRSTVSDGMGGTVDSWDTIATNIAACVAHAKGRETLQAERLSSITPIDITIRKTSAFTITANDRLRDLRTDELYSVKWTGAFDLDTRHVVIVATLGEPHGG